MVVHRSGKELKNHLATLAKLVPNFICFAIWGPFKARSPDIYHQHTLIWYAIEGIYY